MEPKFPLMNEWINKMWYNYTVVYYSAIKSSKVLTQNYNITEPGKHYAKWKKPATKDYVEYASIYMKYPQQTNP